MEADVTRTQRPALFIFDRKMKLILSDLIPSAALARRQGFRNLLQPDNFAIEMFGRGLEFRRHRDVYMMKRSDHLGPLFSERRSWSADILVGGSRASLL